MVVHFPIKHSGIEGLILIFSKKIIGVLQNIAKKKKKFSNMHA